MSKIFNTIEVLIVEDSKPDYRVVERMLQDTSNIELNWAKSLKSAYDIINRPDKDISVILLDLNLPESRGLETLSRVHQTYDSIPVIVMTGLDEEEQGTMAARRGAQEYLTKGKFDQALLIRAIHWAIERNRLQQKLMEMLVLDIKGLDSRKLLPACAGCGNVRDSVTNEWVSMDDYLERRANLFLTHGLCPTCMQQHYGKILEEEEVIRQKKREETTRSEGNS